HLEEPLGHLGIALLLEAIARSQAEDQHLLHPQARGAGQEQDFALLAEQALLDQEARQHPGGAPVQKASRPAQRSLVGEDAADQETGPRLIPAGQPRLLEREIHDRDRYGFSVSWQMRSRMPLMNAPESSAPKRLASSMASLRVTRLGISGR